MKYAILGPRKAVQKILEAPADGTVELTDEQASAVLQIREDKEIPLFLDGQVLSLNQEVKKPGVFRWDQNHGTWVRTAPKGSVPQSMRAWQARAAMRLTPLGSTTLYAAAQQAIDALPAGPEKIIIEAAWEGNADFSRSSPAILSLSTALGLTHDQVDDLFRMGANLTV